MLRAVLEGQLVRTEQLDIVDFVHICSAKSQVAKEIEKFKQLCEHAASSKGKYGARWETFPFTVKEADKSFYESLGTSASLVVTSALLVVTRSY